MEFCLDFICHAASMSNLSPLSECFLLQGTGQVLSFRKRESFQRWKLTFHAEHHTCWEGVQQFRVRIRHPLQSSVDSLGLRVVSWHSQAQEAT